MTESYHRRKRYEARARGFKGGHIGGYDHARRILEVEYKPGGVYDYFGVPPDVYEALMQAESIGEYVNSSVKPFYLFQKVS